MFSRLSGFFDCRNGAHGPEKLRHEGTMVNFLCLTILGSAPFSQGLLGLPALLAGAGLAGADRGAQRRHSLLGQRALLASAHRRAVADDIELVTPLMPLGQQLRGLHRLAQAARLSRSR